MDPNVVPNAPPEVSETPEAPIAPPEIDIESAYQTIIEKEGYDPRLARYEFDELKRRRTEMDRMQRELELEKSRMEVYREQRQTRNAYDDLDPITRRVMERLDRIDEREEQRERQRIETERRESLNQQMTEELIQSYQDVVRRAPTHAQVDQNTFFNVHMASIYPDGVPASLGARRAVENVARILGIGGSGATAQPPPRPFVNGSGPRAQVYIPSGTSAQVPPPTDGDAQRPGESLEDYVMRKRRWATENRIRTTPDREGVRFVVE